MGLPFYYGSPDTFTENLSANGFSVNPDHVYDEDLLGTWGIIQVLYNGLPVIFDETSYVDTHWSGSPGTVPRSVVGNIRFTSHYNLIAPTGGISSCEWKVWYDIGAGDVLVYGESTFATDGSPKSGVNGPFTILFDLPAGTDLANVHIRNSVRGQISTALGTPLVDVTIRCNEFWLTEGLSNQPGLQFV